MNDAIDLVEDKGQAVKYTVLQRSLIGNEIFEEGTTCSYDGLPAENLAPQCAIGEARYQQYLTSNKERQAAQKAQYAAEAGFDSAAFGAAVAKAIAEANANQAALISDAVAAAIAKVFPNGTSKKAADPVAVADSAVSPIA